ncbi:hypothetical protein BDV37DRAFT_89987 [Aspergillus pseudonomiae]|uniref:Zn(2)-C6 fungal-type domain-containing protein n=1 Tax=Aspergillus pseudonomiae TaxID=1506151 RepID=A0A5N7DGM5_9EURO|nr:uncharacterized protein BDV37DRAFT_89987 [Aspergillus pseudonomiae]KAE8405582.1 hypothetical protein BDV37DRAFT_89987 [Aspergillus pseudonomiae]
MACDRCHSKKLKCVGGIPCSSCRTRGESCLFKRRGHRNARACSNQTLTQVEGGSPSFLHRATSKTLADVDDTERTSNAAHNYSRASNAEAAAGEYSQGQPELGLSWDELLDSTVVSTGSLPYSDNLTLFDFLAFEAEATQNGQSCRRISQLRRTTLPAHVNKP